MQEQNLDHEYAPINGVAQFNKLVQELQLGAGSAVVKEKRVRLLAARFDM